MGRIAADSASLMAFNIIYIMRTNIEAADYAVLIRTQLTIPGFCSWPIQRSFYFG